MGRLLLAKSLTRSKRFRPSTRSLGVAALRIDNFCWCGLGPASRIRIQILSSELKKLSQLARCSRPELARRLRPGSTFRRIDSAEVPAIPRTHRSQERPQEGGFFPRCYPSSRRSLCSADRLGQQRRQPDSRCYQRREARSSIVRSDFPLRCGNAPTRSCSPRTLKLRGTVTADFDGGGLLSGHQILEHGGFASSVAKPGSGLGVLQTYFTDLSGWSPSESALLIDRMPKALSSL